MVVKCGTGVATVKQARLIKELDKITDITYKGKTVKEASKYITYILHPLSR